MSSATHPGEEHLFGCRLPIGDILANGGPAIARARNAVTDARAIFTDVPAVVAQRHFLAVGLGSGGQTGVEGQGP